MNDTKKIILVLSCPLVIAGIAIIIIAGYNLFTFTMLNEYNFPDTLMVIFASFFWGLLGAYITLTLWFPYCLYFLLKEAFEGLAIGLSLLSGKSVQQNETRSAKSVEAVVYENIYNKLTKTMRNELVTAKSMSLLWGLCILGGVVGIFAYFSLHGIQVLLYNILGITYYPSSNSPFAWIPFVIFGGVNSFGLADFVMSLRKGSRSESIAKRTLKLYELIKIILKISTCILIVMIILIFIINKVQPGLVLEIPALVSSLSLNVTIFLSVWMLSYYLFSDFKFYLARACFLKSVESIKNDNGDKNDKEETRYLLSGLEYYNEYLGRNIGFKFVKLEVLNAIYQEEQKNPYEKQENSIRTTLYQSFGVPVDVNNRNLLDPLRLILKSLHNASLSEVRPWERYKDLVTTVAIPLVSTIISFIQLGLQPVK
jgi:hypothetical protein